MESENSRLKPLSLQRLYMYVYNRKKSFRGIKDKVIILLYNATLGKHKELQSYSGAPRVREARARGRSPIANNLVPRGRDPFGQRRGSGPLARWDFESANRGLPVTLRRIKSKTQDGGEKCRYISGRREIWIRKSWKSKYYTQTETRRDPENNRIALT